MIFGTLNPEKIWHERLTHLSTSPVRCSHFTLGNPKKSFFNIIIHILQIIYITSEAKPIATVVVQFQLFTYCCLVLPVICIALVLHLGHATGGARVLIRTCWSLRQRLVATWAEFQHSVVYNATDHVKKDWKHVLMQKVVTLNTSCDIACLTTGTFQSHRWQPTTDSLQSLQRLKERNKPLVR